MSKILYIKLGDVCLVELSKDPKNLCDGHRMFNMEGQTLEMICLYSDFYKEFYFTDNGITYTSKRKKARVVKILGNIHTNLTKSEWSVFYNRIHYPPLNSNLNN